MFKVLTIEDDAATAEEIRAELAGRGFEVEIVADGAVGLDRALHGHYDVITLDRMLPRLDGLSIVMNLRQAGVDTPVLMISALSDVDERVRGLRAGGEARGVDPASFGAGGQHRASGGGSGTRFDPPQRASRQRAPGTAAHRVSAAGIPDAQLGASADTLDDFRGGVG